MSNCPHIIMSLNNMFRIFDFNIPSIFKFNVHIQEPVLAWSINSGRNVSGLLYGGLNHELNLFSFLRYLICIYVLCTRAELHHSLFLISHLLHCMWIRFKVESMDEEVNTGEM